jgi:transcriptional regulator with XRE-family HTH domain
MLKSIIYIVLLMFLCYYYHVKEEKMSYFSTNLKFLREQKKLSQNKLAEMANVNQTTIMRWESGEMSPSLDNIYDIANALNISVADLTGKNLKEDDVEFDELDLLFDKHKDILTESDKTLIKTIIEQRKKEIDKELGEDNE